MHKIIYCILTATALSVANASPYTERLVEAARKAGWTETQIDRLQGLCSDYERAATALHEFQELSGLKPQPIVRTTINADVRDKAIQQIAKVAKDHRNRYEVLRKTVSAYDPTRTNLFARAARASMQTKLDDARLKAHEFFVQATNNLARVQLSEARLESIRSQINSKREEYQTKYSSGNVITRPIYSTIVSVFDAILEKFEKED